MGAWVFALRWWLGVDTRLVVHGFQVLLVANDKQALLLPKPSPLIMANTSAAPLRTFVMYAHEDKPVRDKLLRQLRPLADNGDLDLWSDHEIKPGELWDEAIRERLAQSELILLLVSDDFFASDYIRNVELRQALARHERGETRLLPIIARHCGWDDVPALARLQVLPPEGRPIVSKEWDSPDEPYRRVYEGVKVAIASLRVISSLGVNAPPPVAQAPAPEPMPARAPARIMPAPAQARTPAHEGARRAFAWRVPVLLAGAALIAFLLWRSCTGFPTQPAESAKGGPNISAAEKTAGSAAQPPEKQTRAEPKPSGTNPPAGADKAAAKPSEPDKRVPLSSEKTPPAPSSQPAEPEKKTAKPAPEYDFQLPPENGMARVRREKKPQWGFLDTGTQKVLPYWYQEVENFNASGRAYVKQNNQRFWIDKTGRCVDKCQ